MGDDKRMKCRVTNIQRFCLDDGPGIRTTVFLKGCPLSCLWCHNPECRDMHPEMMLNRQLCVNCRECAAVCEAEAHSFDDFHKIDRDTCILCGKCVNVCPKFALELSGKDMTIDEIIGIVEQDIVFYGDNGGLTLSGGEPLLFPEFSAALLEAAHRKGIGTAVETSGFADFNDIIPLIHNTDHWLYDFKAGPEDKHVRLCGQSNLIIHDNLIKLAGYGADLVIRYPIVPGINDCDDDFEILARIASKAGNPPVQLMPYHTLGKSKSDRLDIECPDILPGENANSEYLELIYKKLASKGLNLTRDSK